MCAADRAGPTFCHSASVLCVKPRGDRSLVGGSHLSEQLRSCLRGWSGSARAGVVVLVVRRRKNQGGLVAAQWRGSPSGPRQGCGQVVRAQGWGLVSRSRSGPVVGVKIRISSGVGELWRHGAVQGKGRGRYPARFCHAGGCCQLGERGWPRAQCQGLGS